MITQRIKQYIADHQLLKPKAKVIIGLSGGADSVALLDILHNLGFECICAHCNFHLRGDESNRDAEFVRQLTTQYNLPLDIIDFDTTAYASEKGISIEMAARELRYNWFEEVRKKYDAITIAVAHHKDDSIETVLLNLIRGTGIRGLTGIVARNGYIVRPLLCVTRNEILDYLNSKALAFVNDSTNEEDIYTRNKIRLNILPLLETINPSVKDAIQRSSENLLQVENIYKHYVEEAIKVVVYNNRVSIAKLLQYTEPKAILFEILSPYGFNPSTINDIYESLNGISGKIFYSSSHKLLKDREYLIIDKKDSTTEKVFFINETDKHISSPINLKIDTILRGENFIIDKARNILYADKNKINFPLTIRHWKQGDWFVPFGIKGKKKVSDYFSDQKFSLFDKENTWLLCSGNDILWIIGYRSDERYKITDSTKEILKITLL